MSDWSPKRAARAWMQHRRNQNERKAAKGHDALIPDIQDSSYTTEQRADAIAFFLLEWLSGGLTMLPDDLQKLPTSSSALKGHTRPDGGVFLGLYELEGAAGSGVVLFGDLTMTEEQAKSVVHQFRVHHARQAKELGTGPTPKLVS